MHPRRPGVSRTTLTSPHRLSTASAGRCLTQPALDAEEERKGGGKGEKKSERNFFHVRQKLLKNGWGQSNEFSKG